MEEEADMKRMHVHVSVDNVPNAVGFYPRFSRRNPPW